jgi:CxxC-x17-CxxC domain-containing protein
MYPATCSNCGKETEVPFMPRSDKPVFCRECFAERRAAAPRGYGNYYSQPEGDHFELETSRGIHPGSFSSSRYFFFFDFLAGFFFGAAFGFA